MATQLPTPQRANRSTAIGGVPTGYPESRLWNCDDDALGRLGSRKTLQRGHPLFREGDEAHAVYRVVSGAIRTSRLMQDGRRYVADFVFPGDFIGLNDGRVRTTTAEALCETVLICCSRHQFDAMLEADRRLGRMVLTILSGGLTNAENRMLMLGRKTAAERVASFLLTMMARKGCERFELPMTREDIADYLGLTIETISRMISLFRTKRIIRTEGATSIVIEDLDALEDLAQSA